MKYKREILVSIEWLVAVLLILFPVVKIVQFVNQEITAEIAASKPMMAFAVETEEPVVEIVRSIDNNRIAEAQGLIGKMLFDDSVPKTVNEYFNEFNAYYAVQEDYKMRFILYATRKFLFLTLSLKTFLFMMLTVARRLFRFTAYGITRRTEWGRTICMPLTLCICVSRLSIFRNTV